MEDLRALVRPAVAGATRYDPGPTLEELSSRFGVTELVKLNWNESLFPPLPGVEEAIGRERERLWMYPEQAYADLRLALGGWLGIEPGAIVPAHGIQALVGSVAQVFLSPGDLVVTAKPTYGLYRQVVRAAGATLVEVPVDSSFGLDLPAMARAARDRGASMVIVCDPNNPTGRTVGAGAWQDFLEALPPRCVVAVDEAYVDFLALPRRDARVADVLAGAPVVLLRTFSKLFGLAGLRLGYAIVHPDLADCFDAVQEPFNLNRAALAAGLAALAAPGAVEARRQEVVACRTRLEAGLGAAGFAVVASDANFVLVGLDGPGSGRGRALETYVTSDTDFAAAMIRRGLVPRAGSEFGLAGWLRITVGPVAMMDRVVEAMVAARADLARHAGGGDAQTD